MDYGTITYEEHERIGVLTLNRPKKHNALSLEMLLTGEFISAATAMDYGLINRVVPEEELDGETRQLAEQIAQYSLLPLSIGKQAFYQQIHMADRPAYNYAKEVISANATMTDAIEGVSAFLEKRAPVWKEK